MKEKLTLSIDKKTKEKAKRFAQKKGTSISKMVETYLDSLSSGGMDLLQQFGEHPVDTGVQDGAADHDRYIYSSEEKK